MLLRPRKNTYKSVQKKRSINKNSTSLTFFKKSKQKPYINSKFKLSYGQCGLKNNSHNYLLYNKYLFKIKLFLKKAVRRSNITNRRI